MEKLVNDERLQADLVTVVVVAAILGITSKAVYTLIRAKKLEAINVGAGKRSAFRVSSESVKRFIRERQTM